MNSTLILIIAIVFIVTFNFLANSWARKYLDNLVSSQTSDPQGCLNKLDTFLSKCIIPYYQRTVLKVNCLGLLKNYPELENLFDQFNQKVQSKRSLTTVRDKAMLYQKEVSHYIHQNNKEKAYESNRYLQNLKNATNDEFTLSLIQESNDCIQIYLDHNFSYLDKGKEIIKTNNNSVFKGIWHYRLAYLYYLKENKKEMTMHLTNAVTLLKESELYPTVKQVKDNPSDIENYIL